MGYDAGKKVKGRKLHALVDTEGLPLRVVVHSAGIQDRDGAARVFEATSALFQVPSPLTRDFLDIGHVSYYGDTRRMRADLLPTLKYPTMRDGADIF